MAAQPGNGTALAILIGVWATFGLDVFSTFTSSPQTTEINAKARAGTLMKWVWVGAAVAVGGGIAGSISAKRPAPFVATFVVAAAMVVLYVHAKNRGLAADEPGTEY